MIARAIIPLLLVALAQDGADRIDADVLLVAGHVLTMDAAGAVHSPGAVAVKGTKIVAVGDESAVRSRVRATKTIEARDAVLLPGLVNAHTHAAMTLFRGFTDGLPLESWLATRIFPAEKLGVTPESVRAGTRLALAEMARAGTTTACDLYYFMDVVAEEFERAGMRGVLGSTVIGFPAPDAPDVAAALARAKALLEKYRGHPLVVPGVAPHSTYTVDVETLKKCRALATSYGAPLLIHLSETRAEVEDVTRRHGRSPIAHAEAIGLFSGPTVAAHCVHPTDEDVATLARRGVGVAHCPESNMKLGSGVAPVPKLLAAGVAVGLGTDGAASNDDLNLFEEIDTAAKLQKVAALDPTALDAKAAVRMATIGGARALFLDAKIGSIEVGKEADLTLVGGSREGLQPMGDPWSFVAYVAKGSDVAMTMVAGRIVFDGEGFPTIDGAGAARDVRAWREKIEAAMSGGGGGGEEEPTEVAARLEIVAKGGLAAWLEQRTIVSSRGFVATLTMGRPKPGDVFHWRRWNVDPAAAAKIATDLEAAGFGTKISAVTLDPKQVVMDAPHVTWRLTLGGKTFTVEVDGGAEFGDEFPPALRAATEAIGRIIAAPATESGSGPAPSDLLRE